jgi:ribonucleoside-diphosphate reductase alpha chain
MVILDVSHPDIEDFIWCKAREERKARVLRDAGFDMDLDGEGFTSIQYQNANNSVRVSDEFMAAVEADGDWDLRAVNGGDVVETVRARDLYRQIMEAAWECADPGMQFDTTINHWHTAHEDGRINGSNPCSEYMFLDNSACNLASLNLLKFLREDGVFDTESFRRAVDIIVLAQDILVDNSSYPTPEITANAHAFRELGLGYANLGALLMSIMLLMLPSIDRIGRALLLSVAAYGFATMAFGISRSFVVSLVAFPAVGMADQVSVIMRTMTIQSTNATFCVPAISCSLAPTCFASPVA